MKGIVTGTVILAENDTLIDVSELKNTPFTVYGGATFGVNEFTTDYFYELNGDYVVGDMSIFYNNKIINVCDHPDVKKRNANKIVAYDVDVEWNIIVTSNEQILLSGKADVLNKEMYNFSRALLIDQQIELGRSWKKENKVTTFRGKV